MTDTPATCPHCKHAIHNQDDCIRCTCTWQQGESIETIREREASASAATALTSHTGPFPGPAADNLIHAIEHGRWHEYERETADDWRTRIARIQEQAVAHVVALAAQPAAGSAEPRWPSRDEMAKALEWAMAPNPRHEGRHRTEPRCREFMPADGTCDCGFREADAILAALREGGEAREP